MKKYGKNDKTPLLSPRNIKHNDIKDYLNAHKMFVELNVIILNHNQKIDKEDNNEEINDYNIENVKKNINIEEALNDNYFEDKDTKEENNEQRLTNNDEVEDEEDEGAIEVCYILVKSRILEVSFKVNLEIFLM